MRDPRDLLRRLGGAVRRGAPDDLADLAGRIRLRRRPSPEGRQGRQGRARREFPTRWARTRPVVAVRDGLQRFGLRPLLHAEVRPHVEGLDVLDGLRPPVIFVANHASHLDTALILCTLPDAWRRRTTLAAAADYFFDVWWRAAGSALIFNTFPIERRSGKLATTPGSVLDGGWNVVIYPEGTRSPDGWTQRFRLGAAYLAVQQGVPVVPIALRGSYAAMPRGRNWPVPGRPPVSVRYGRALVPQDGESPRLFAKRVQGAVARLLDEDATTWWAAARRAADGTTPSPAGPDAAPWRRIWTQTAAPQLSPRRTVWTRKRRVD